MNQTNTHDLPPEDTDLVAGWLYADKKRWAAGIITGLFAGLVAIAVGGIISLVGGMEFWFPVKLMGTALVGAGATEIGPNFSGIIAGLVLIEVLAAFWGFVYSHFVKTNSLGSLLAMGLVWGVFGWIFHWNLYFHSIRTILASNVSSVPAFFVFLSYGLSLSSIRFFDRAVRGGR